MNVHAIEDNYTVWGFIVTENSVDKIINKWVIIFFKNIVLLS